MAEQLVITKADKEGIYLELIPQIEAIIEGESDIIANMANIAAILKEAFNFLWIGFYIVKSNEANIQELVLGPFQGPLACTRIAYGRGVCGTSWKESKTLIVPNVEEFPGHIACSSLSKSEIVVPCFDSLGFGVMGIIDVDSSDLETFDLVDKKYLEKIASLIWSK